MNTVWPLPDWSWTMPLTRPALVGAHRNDVAAVAQRDERLLQDAGELGAVDERLEPRPQPLVGDAHRSAQPAQRG